MNSQAKEILFTTVLVIVGLYFLILGLNSASAFLAPLTIALVISMVLISLTRKLEVWGLPRGLASLISVLLSFLIVAIVVGMFSVQVKRVAEDWPKIKQNITPGIESVQRGIGGITGMSPDEQKAFMQSILPFAPDGQQEGDNGDAEKASNISRADSDIAVAGQKSSKPSAHGVSSGTVGMIGNAMVGFFSGVGNFLLVFVYIFFLLFYRRKIKLAILEFFPESKRDEAKAVLSKSVVLSEQYLLGRLMLITFLVAIYGVGLSIAGIKNAIFISVFAALLSMVPYIGNMIGFILAMAMAAFTGGGMFMYVGVLITFGVAQFLESYILEPYVVGDKVDLNPLVTILVVVIGGSVWGVAGMIISIPVFGIIKIISDHIPALHPIGFALGETGDGEEGDDFFTRIVRKIKNRWKRK